MRTHSFSFSDHYKLSRIVYISIIKPLNTTNKKKESWYTYTGADSDLNQLQYSKTMRALNKWAALIDNRDSDGKDIS
jgi:hypothetical protein